MCLRIDDFTDDPSYWYNPEYKEIEKELKSLPVDAFKVLYVHWGNEYINRPSSAQKKFDLDTKLPFVEYIHIENDCTPVVADETKIPAEWRFSYLNEVLKKEDNSEQYHAEISRNYAAYRKANHRYIINNIIKHPALGNNLLKDYIKRKILK